VAPATPLQPLLLLLSLMLLMLRHLTPPTCRLAMRRRRLRKFLGRPLLRLLLTRGLLQQRLLRQVMQWSLDGPRCGMMQLFLRPCCRQQQKGHRLQMILQRQCSTSCSRRSSLPMTRQRCQMPQVMERF
jgi:hypothetical protein